MDALTPAIAIDTEDITDLPLFNEVQLEIKKFHLGQGTVEAIDRPIVELEDLLGKIFAHLHEQLHYQAETPELAAVVPVVYDAFAMLQVEIPFLRRALHNDDREAAVDHLNHCRATVGRLTEGLAELKRLEEAEPKFCDIPLLNDVCRVTLLVLQRKLEPELMRARVDQSWDLWDQLCDIVNTHLGGQGEESLTPLGQALAQVEHALSLLEEVFAALPAAMMEPLEEAIDLLGTGSEVLLDHYRQLQESPPAGDVLVCFRCSQENPPGSSTCSRCNAIFPNASCLASSLNVDESGRGHEWPTHVGRLIAEVEAFRAGRSSPQKVLDAVKDLQTRMQRGLASIGSIEVLDEDAPADQHEQLKSFYTRLSSNIEKALAALASMTTASIQGDPVAVDRYLAEFLVPVEQLLDLQRQLGGILAAQAEN